MTTEELQTENDTLKARIEVMTDKIITLEREKAELETANASFVFELDAAKVKLSETAAKNATLGRELQQLQTANAQVASLLDEQRRANAVLQTKLDNRPEDMIALQKAVETYKAGFETQTKAHETSLKATEKLRVKYDRLRIAYNEDSGRDYQEPEEQAAERAKAKGPGVTHFGI